MFNSASENTTFAPQMRKSVENLVISSHDAIGQSISHALSFSGAITHQYNSDHKSVSRSPSPCRHLSPSIPEHGDSSGHSQDNVSGPRYGESPPLLGVSPVGSHTPQPRSVSQERPPTRQSKKKSWYSALYPTYKSRSEDFKRIFKDVPDDERLIVDYSCAIQKDILVHGRLYISQNYLCFYANIFRWETFLSLKWKDVTAITKEKTALVIPNAILVSTETEKHFLTSFAGRDKAYLMLFRVWQNALMDKPMSSQEMWQWVHTCYGEELGFNSDDEEYPQNFTEDDKLSLTRMSAESISEDMLEQQGLENKSAGGAEELPPCEPANTQHSTDPSCPQWQPQSNKHVTNGSFNGGDALPTDMSDSSESDPDKPNCFEIHQCTDPHEGRKLLSEDINLHIDQLFTMLFTNSKFYVELLTARKTTDLVQAPWKHDLETGLKSRKVSFTLLLGQAVGPKTAQVTETQVMLACTRPGHLYSIEVTSANAGIPYADSFTVMVHYCLQRVAENVTRLEVLGNVKYKKNVWGLVKTFIEKNCYAGLEDYFDCFIKSLQLEVEDDRGPSKRKSRRRRRGIGVQREIEVGISPASPLHRPLPAHKLSLSGAVCVGAAPPAPPPPSARLLWGVLLVLGALLLLNALLYYRLWGLEASSAISDAHLEDRFSSRLTSNNENIVPTPELIAEWSNILKEQSSFHIEELDTWRKALNDAISLLKQTEVALSNLQKIIKPSSSSRPPSPSPPHTEL